MANERISMRKIRDIIRLRGKRARLSTDRPCPAVPRNAVATRPDDTIYEGDRRRPRTREARFAPHGTHSANRKVENVEFTQSHE